jgi:hypothetical protein
MLEAFFKPVDSHVNEEGVDNNRIGSYELDIEDDLHICQLLAATNSLALLELDGLFLPVGKCSTY